MHRSVVVLGRGPSLLRRSPHVVDGFRVVPRQQVAPPVKLAELVHRGGEPLVRGP